MVSVVGGLASLASFLNIGLPTLSGIELLLVAHTTLAALTLGVVLRWERRRPPRRRERL